MNKNNNEIIIQKNKLAYLIISFVQGITTISDLAVQYFFKDVLLLQPAEMSRVMSILMIPWIIKPILGLITDLVPIFGYRRKVYICGCGFISIICWVLLAYSVPGLIKTTIYLFIISLAFSFASVLGEAIVVELSNLEEDDPTEKAKHYVSLFFLCKNIGVLIASFFKGYLVEILTMKQMFLFAALVPMLTFIAGLILVEKRIQTKDDKSISINQDVKENLLEKDDKNNIVLEKKQLIKEFLWFIKKKEAYIPAIYVVILFASPNFGDPLFYYMTNFLFFTPSELGIISLMSTIGVLFAIISYRHYFKKFTFKVIVGLSASLYFLFTFIALLLVLRFNISIGVSDFTVCVLGFMFLSVLGELSMMPMLSLACLICPKNLEATVYSFFMSALNLGLLISILSGSVLTQYLGVTANNFQNLPDLIVISNIGKLVPIALLFFIDNKYFEPAENKDIVIRENKEVIEDSAEVLNNPGENIKKLII